MKKLLLLTLAIAISLSTAMAGKKAKRAAANADTDMWHYELTQRKIAKQGYLLLEVWSYSVKPEIAAAQACKNAVHGVVYKGVPAGGANTMTQKPMVNTLNLSPEAQAYLKEFFADGGPYMSYVALTSNGVVGQTSVLKIARRRYKVGVTVEVNSSQLRKALEGKGVIRGLNSGF